jgi:hypothetical protein
VTRDNEWACPVMAYKGVQHVAVGDPAGILCVPGRQNDVNKTGTTRVTVKHGEPRTPGSTDWERIDAMIDEEAAAPTPADTYARPVSEERMAKMRQVPRVKILRAASWNDAGRICRGIFICPSARCATGSSIRATRALSPAAAGDRTRPQGDVAIAGRSSKGAR